MNRTQQEQILVELVITVITTLVILLIWYAAEIPDWKRKAFYRRVTGRVVKHGREHLSPAQMMELARFRTEVSKYSHGGTQETPG